MDTLDTEHWPMDTGHWTLDTEYWTLDTGHLTLNTEQCAINTWHQTLDTGHWTLNTEHWTMCTKHLTPNTWHQTLYTGECHIVHKTLDLLCAKRHIYLVFILYPLTSLLSFFSYYTLQGVPRNMEIERRLEYCLWFPIICKRHKVNEKSAFFAYLKLTEIC